MKIRLLILFFGLLSGWGLQAWSSNPPDEAALEKKHSSWYPKEKEHAPQAEKVRKPFNLFDIEVPESLRIIFLLVVIAGVLGVLIYYLMKNPVISRNAPKMEAGIQEGFEVADDDLEDALANALQTRNYTLVIRYTYLYLLKHMEQAGWIERHPYKTNHAYYQEVRSPDMARMFIQMTRKFEDVWYGRYPVEAKQAETYYQEVMHWVQQLPDQTQKESHA